MAVAMERRRLKRLGQDNGTSEPQRRDGKFSGGRSGSIPGEGFDSALTAAVEFRSQGVGALFTLLGENVTDLADANKVVEHYEEVLAASTGVRAEISVKPTQLGLDIDEDAAYANLQRLARAAEKASSFLWIDMEGSHYTDRTVALYRRLRLETPHVGIALQAYLYRTVSDITTLLPLKPAVRLVKGAYAESQDIAFVSKRDVDANYLALCVFMLPEVKHRKLRLVMATHDVELIARTWRFAQARCLALSSRSRCFTGSGRTSRCGSPARDSS